MLGRSNLYLNISVQSRKAFEMRKTDGSCRSGKSGLIGGRHGQGILQISQF
jgi:hypothetical protein